jgi:hypothetical protein
MWISDGSFLRATNLELPRPARRAKEALPVAVAAKMAGPRPSGRMLSWALADKGVGLGTWR